MSGGHFTPTEDPGEYPWASVNAQDDPWEDVPGSADAWDTDTEQSAWAVDRGQFPGRSASAGQPVALADLAGLLTTASALPRPVRGAGADSDGSCPQPDRRVTASAAALASAAGSAVAAGAERESMGAFGQGDEPREEQPGIDRTAGSSDSDPESVARTIVLRQLTAAPRSRQQLVDALARRDVPEEVANRVLDRFTEVGLIDDAAYAEMLVRTRHAERGLSRRALALELHRKGICAEHAAAALDQVDDQDEESAARALARKKLRATRGLDSAVRLRRTYAALGRKGYSSGLVSRVVREELAADGEQSIDTY